jgi:antibiotic biosynthesis monooxygenase (ABM) superfamily enzyme
VWIRSAFWVGKAKAGSEVAFREAVDELVPALRKLPGVSDAKALWPRRLEDNPPAVACQILVEFAGLAQVDLMLASAERRALRERVGQMLGLFDGVISHIDYEVA